MYAIYLFFQEEEEERSERWTSFLQRQAESAQLPVHGLSNEEDNKVSQAETPEQELDSSSEKGVDGDVLSNQKPGSNSPTKNDSDKEELAAKETKAHGIQIWNDIRSSLHAIEDMMSIRIKKKSNLSKQEQDTRNLKPLLPTEEFRSPKGASEEESEDEFYDVERSDPTQDVPSSDNVNASATGAASDVVPTESLFPWKEELEVLVRGGVPMALRGEVHIMFSSCLFLFVSLCRRYHYS